MRSMFNMFSSFGIFGRTLKNKVMKLFISSDNRIMMSSDNKLEGVL